MPSITTIIKLIIFYPIGKPIYPTKILGLSDLFFPNDWYSCQFMGCIAKTES